MTTKSTKRPSALSWLGDLPSDWDVVPLKQRTISVTRGRSPEYADDESGIPVINQACVYWDGIRFENVKWHRGALKGDRGRLRPGDLLINSTGTGTLGRAAVFEKSGEYLADSHLTVVRTTENANPSFLRYVIQTDAYQGYLTSVLSPGATNQIELSRSGLRRTSFPMPRIDQQVRISSFLDRKTAAVDALIQKKKRLIELLVERRATVVHQAVTQGIDPATPLKESGVKWLGLVPARWIVARLRHVIQGGTKNGVYKSSDFYGNGGTPLIQMGEAFAKPIVDKVASGRVRLTAQEQRTYELRPGDLLFARRSLVLEGSGKAALIGTLSETHAFESSLIRVRPDPKRIVPRFLHLFLSSAFSRAETVSITKQVTISGVDSQQVKDLHVVVPPLNEQAAIVTHLDATTGQLAKVIDAIQVQLATLREYRQSVIAAAVTGKLDVLEAVV